jgi:glycosyltransferase involved in cell wall biosynthesis
MKLVIVMPALNEEATIGQVIAAVPKDVACVDDVAVLVVDDGSTDRTAGVAAEAGAIVVRHWQNRGVGAAFRTGVTAALARGADVIVNMDADGQFNPADIPTLVEPILAGEADMTTCTRFARPELVPRMPAVKRWGNRMMCSLINRICWNARFTDVSCGFRAYSREAAMSLTLFGNFTYTQESFIDLVAKGIHIVEVPLKVRGVRAVGESRVTRNVWHYAVAAATIVVRAARDIRPLAFFGSIGLVIFVLGLGCAGTVFGWWLATGHTSPIKSLLIGAAAFLILGFLLIVLALIADMLGRQRALLHQVLYTLRKSGRPGPATGGERWPAAAQPPSKENT